ncbi:MAG: hypothetical protein ABFD46_07480 [Armatimonadota bacterium]
MSIRTAVAILTLVLAVLLTLPALAGNADLPRYFGPGPGYPDYGSARYFYNYYPSQSWEVYGYGTGHMGMGYGPYIYGGQRGQQTLLDRPDLAMPMVKPRVKWIGGNEVKVAAPSRPGTVVQLTVDVLAFNGDVLETGTVTSPPYEIIARVPEGATSIRVHISLADQGFSAVVYPIVPVR